MPRWEQSDYDAYLARRAGAGVKVRAAKPECIEATTLDSAVQGTNQSLGRIGVRFVFCRVRPFDCDNSYSSAKNLLDGLRYASLIPGDSESEIDLKVEQVKVAHRNEQKTVIVITYPAEEPGRDSPSQV